ncbi:hypothetical protein LGN16_27065 [Burkholderia vietnamiensis]|nr:hypothetical protein [Burkholderia vietnamiensis]
MENAGRSPLTRIATTPHPFCHLTLRGVVRGSLTIKQQMGKYPLVLEFAGHTSSGNDYLADVPVKIVDAHGKTVLSTRTTGPFLLVSMPDGRYTVSATYNRQTMRRSVDVRESSHAHSMFVWTM